MERTFVQVDDKGPIACCPAHADKPAVGTCQRCGAFFCENCACRGARDRCARCRPEQVEPLLIAAKRPFSLAGLLSLTAALFHRNPSRVAAAATLETTFRLVLAAVTASPLRQDRFADFLPGVAFAFALTHTPLTAWVARASAEVLGVSSKRRVPVLSLAGATALHAAGAAVLTSFAVVGAPPWLLVAVAATGSAVIDLASVALGSGRSGSLLSALHGGSRSPGIWSRLVLATTLVGLPTTATSIIAMSMFGDLVTHGRDAGFSVPILMAFLVPAVLASTVGLGLEMLLPIAGWVGIDGAARHDRDSDSSNAAARRV